MWFCVCRCISRPVRWLRSCTAESSQTAVSSRLYMLQMEAPTPLLSPPNTHWCTYTLPMEHRWAPLPVKVYRRLAFMIKVAVSNIWETLLIFEIKPNKPTSAFIALLWKCTKMQCKSGCLFIIAEAKQNNASVTLKSVTILRTAYLVLWNIAKPMLCAYEAETTQPLRPFSGLPVYVSNAGKFF